MNRSGITLLGLGPGGAELLTREAWNLLSSSSELYLRTGQHPAVSGLPAGLILHTFDKYYEMSSSFEEVYESIINEILALGSRPGGVIYAVPGHPFVAEATCPEIARRAHATGIPLNVIDGMSFLEPTFTALHLDPFSSLALVDGLELAALHTPPFSPAQPAIVAQIHSREIASEVKLTLMSLYPDEHPVKLIHAAGTRSELVESLALFEIDRSRHIGVQTSLYLPALSEAAAFESFQEVIAHLRAPDGCPWDREQTHQTLRPHLLEETYEALEAMDADDSTSMQEEFGDLLLQIVLNAQIASELGEFNMADVLKGIHEKIVRRHPHVFGELEISDPSGVVKNWQKLKAEERQAEGRGEASLFSGVAQSLPALLQAEQIQQRAAHVGFDWPSIQGVQEKLEEELEEVRQAVNPDEKFSEVGDVMFALVNLARWLDIDAESALRQANQRFRQRFAHIEQTARDRGIQLSDFSLDEMERLWQEAKHL